MRRRDTSGPAASACSGSGSDLRRSGDCLRGTERQDNVNHPLRWRHRDTENGHGERQGRLGTADGKRASCRSLCSLCLCGETWLTLSRGVRSASPSSLHRKSYQDDCPARLGRGHCLAGLGIPPLRDVPRRSGTRNQTRGHLPAALRRAQDGGTELVEGAAASDAISEACDRPADDDRNVRGTAVDVPDRVGTQCLAEVAVPKELFAKILERIGRLRLEPGRRSRFARSAASYESDRRRGRSVFTAPQEARRRSS